MKVHIQSSGPSGVPLCNSTHRYPLATIVIASPRDMLYYTNQDTPVCQTCITCWNSQRAALARVQDLDRRMF